MICTLVSTLLPAVTSWKILCSFNPGQDADLIIVGRMIYTRATSMLPLPIKVISPHSTVY